MDIIPKPFSHAQRDFVEAAMKGDVMWAITNWKVMPEEERSEAFRFVQNLSRLKADPSE